MKTKDSIKKLRSEGKTYDEICNILKINKSTISFHIGESRKDKYKDKHKCKNCNNIIPGRKTYCNKKCQGEYINKERINKIKEGKLETNNSIRKALIHLSENKCTICSQGSNWNNKRLTLQVDHVDGNSDNNNLENLRLVCPNCHSQLETSKKTNKKYTKRNSYLRKYKGYEPL